MKITTVAATIVGASVLLFIQPVFAQSDYGSAAQTPSDAWESPESGDAYSPSFEEPWGDGPVLAPAPSQPEAAEPGSMYVPPPAVGLIEPGDHPAISPNSPTLIPPDSVGIPAGGFHPEGAFHGPASGFHGPIR